MTSCIFVDKILIGAVMQAKKMAGGAVKRVGISKASPDNDSATGDGMGEYPFAKRISEDNSSSWSRPCDRLCNCAPLEFWRVRIVIYRVSQVLERASRREASTRRSGLHTAGTKSKEIWKWKDIWVS